MVTDIIILTAMSFYVKTCHVFWRSWTNCFYLPLFGLLQLTRRRNANIAPFSNHALTRIVRLTVETNVLTSVWASFLVAPIILICFQPLTEWYRCWWSLYSLCVTLNAICSAADSDPSIDNRRTSFITPARRSYLNSSVLRLSQNLIIFS